MKSVIDAVTSIVEDARGSDPRSRDDIDLETVQSLCDRTEATLSNLVTATRTHATSYGLSPVSLLDAALSHVSASVTELTKLLRVRRSTASGQERPPVVSTSQTTKELVAPGGKRDNWKGPASNSYKNEDVRPLNVKHGRGMSDRSSEDASPPPSAVFDTPLAAPHRRPPSEESTPTDVQTDEGAWEELRVSPYSFSPSFLSKLLALALFTNPSRYRDPRDSRCPFWCPVAYTIPRIGRKPYPNHHHSL